LIKRIEKPYVIAGLVPATHNPDLEWRIEIAIMDGRHKAGHDVMGCM
jgi:hypothetical protein